MVPYGDASSNTMTRVSYAANSSSSSSVRQSMISVVEIVVVAVAFKDFSITNSLDKRDRGCNDWVEDTFVLHSLEKNCSVAATAEVDSSSFARTKITTVFAAGLS